MQIDLVLKLVIFSVLMGPFREPFYQCVTYGFYTEESWQEKLYTIFSLLTMQVSNDDLRITNLQLFLFAGSLSRS